MAALVYVYNQFFPLPNLLEIIAQVCWIGVHGKPNFFLEILTFLGDTPIVYLLLNRSLRLEVLKIFNIKIGKIGDLRTSSNNGRLSQGQSGEAGRAEREKNVYTVHDGSEQNS